MITKKRRKRASTAQVRRLRVYDICYDTDGVFIEGLPVSLVFPIADRHFKPDCEAANLISDKTGFLVDKFEWEWLSPYPANKKRAALAAEYAEKALNAYFEAKGDTPDEDLADITDLVTDLRHLAESKNVDFEGVLRMSEGHWEEERDGTES